ncbi:MAG: hypothetical protein PHN78_07690 [Dehalococcoidales bacterium]|nr:hypothetical protein [Dehalococcoidales bacterium]
MMTDNDLSRLPYTRNASNATNDMAEFPAAPYVLYGMTVDNHTVNYFTTRYTNGIYSVDALGTVTQVISTIPTPATSPTTIPTPNVVQEKVKDIETIMGIAEMLSIKVNSITHAGSSITINCQADDYTTFIDYLTALEKSGRFSTPIPRPPDGPPYVTGGSIAVEPKYQYIDMPALYDELNQAPSPIRIIDATAMLVYIAEKSGIDISSANLKFTIPAATTRQVKAVGNTYQVMSFSNIHLQGDYEDVMAFISDLDSQKTLSTMVLTRVVIRQIEANGGIETVAAVDVDIYTTES